MWRADGEGSREDDLMGWGFYSDIDDGLIVPGRATLSERQDRNAKLAPVTVDSDSESSEDNLMYGSFHSEIGEGQMSLGVVTLREREDDNIM